MAKKATLSSRAWNVLRMSFFSSQKGESFKRRFMVGFISSCFKRIRTATHDQNPYEEREFSFSETPIFHFKLHKASSMRFSYLPHIPCINPSFDFDEEDDDDDDGGKSRYVGRDVKEEGEMCIDGLDIDEEGIDSKAEEFIARFYEQMKLQRQWSNLQYTEMLHRGTS